MASLGRKNGGSSGGGEVNRRRELTVWFNVSMQDSLWAVRVKISPENTARELIKAAIDIYVKEKRRPLLRSSDPAFYELHHSQFSFESLKEDAKLVDLSKSRNFYVCAKSCSVDNHDS